MKLIKLSFLGRFKDRVLRCLPLASAKNRSSFGEGRGKGKVQTIPCVEMEDLVTGSQPRSSKPYGLQKSNNEEKQAAMMECSLGEETGSNDAVEALPEGGEAVGPIALSSFESANSSSEFVVRHEGVAKTLGRKCICWLHGIHRVFKLNRISRQHGIRRWPCGQVWTKMWCSSPQSMGGMPECSPPPSKFSPPPPSPKRTPPCPPPPPKPCAPPRKPCPPSPPKPCAPPSPPKPCAPPQKPCPPSPPKPCAPPPRPCPPSPPSPKRTPPPPKHSPPCPPPPPKPCPPSPPKPCAPPQKPCAPPPKPCPPSPPKSWRLAPPVCLPRPPPGMEVYGGRPRPPPGMEVYGGERVYGGPTRPPPGMEVYGGDRVIGGPTRPPPGMEVYGGRPRPPPPCPPRFSLEDLHKHLGCKRRDAAKSLGVSVSTFKRICRQNGIDRWPYPIRNNATLKPSDPHGQENVSPTCFPPDSIGGHGLLGDDENMTTSEYWTTCFPPDSIGGHGLLGDDENMTTSEYWTSMFVSSIPRIVTLKPRYRNTTMRFQFPPTSSLNKLKEKLSKRLKLDHDSFDVKYVDDEGDDILIGCDEDLRHYLFNSLDNPVTRLSIFDKAADH